jgi:hypothetical protein
MSSKIALAVGFANLSGADLHRFFLRILLPFQRF